MFMEASALSIIGAIRQGHPISIQVGRKWGQLPKIIFHVDGVKIGQVACVRYMKPKAFSAGDVARVKSSDRLPGGFDIQCESEQEAQQISELMAICLRKGFDELFSGP